MDQSFFDGSKGVEIMENNEVDVNDMNDTPDVTVILTRDGIIVNGNNGILRGRESSLGKCRLGVMTLGE